MLAFANYSKDLTSTLMKNFNHDNFDDDEVEVVTEHKISGKYGGVLKVYNCCILTLTGLYMGIANKI